MTTLRGQLLEYQLKTNTTDDQLIYILCDFIEAVDDGELELDNLPFDLMTYLEGYVKPQSS